MFYILVWCCSVLFFIRGARSEKFYCFAVVGFARSCAIFSCCGVAYPCFPVEELTSVRAALVFTARISAIQASSWPRAVDPAVFLRCSVRDRVSSLSGLTCP
jgi:hypothetical protein